MSHPTARVARFEPSRYWPIERLKRGTINGS